MARLLADENFPDPVVEALQRMGHNVLTMRDAGLANASLSDESVLEHATKQGRAVLTLNRRHFVKLHGTFPDHAGIIVCTVDLDFEGQAERIDAAMGLHESLGKALLRVNRPG